MKKAIKIMIPTIILAVIAVVMINSKNKEKEEIMPITSQKELEKIYNQKIEEETTLEKLLKLPFSLLFNRPRNYIMGNNMLKSEVDMRSSDQSTNANKYRFINYRKYKRIFYH